MKSLQRSCLRWTLLYFVLAAICGALVYSRAPVAQMAAIVGAVAGFFLFMSIAYIVGMFIRGGEVRLIRRGIKGGRAEEGEKIAVAGTVGTSMSLLEAPATRRRCVLYEYKIMPAGNEQAADVEGFALTPVSIDGVRGSIRLLAAPELAFDPDKVIRVEQHQNLREYLSRTTFTEHLQLNLKNEFKHLRQVLADDDGRIRYDIFRGQKRDLDLSSMSVREKVLVPGEHVVVIGRYSAARNGLVSDPDAMMHSVKVVKGDAQEIARKLKRKDGTDVAMSCGCFLPVLIAAVIGMALVPLEAFDEQFPGRRAATWPEVRVEQWIDRNVRPRFNVGAIPVNLPANTARGRLNDVELKRATLEVLPDGSREVRLAGDDGKGAILVIRERTVVAIRVDEALAGGAVINAPDADLDVLELSDEQVIGRITFLSDAVKLRAAFRAQ